MIAGALTKPGFAILLGVLTLSALIATIVFLLIAIFGYKGDRGRSFTVAGILFVVAIPLWLLFNWSATHKVIQVNTSAIMVETATGKVRPNIYRPGVIKRPMFGVKFYVFPGGTSQEVQISFTPSVKGGYEIGLTLGFYLDASDINWVVEYNKYGQPTFPEILDKWTNQLAPLIADAVKGYNPTQLTSERLDVARGLYQAASTWFESNGITLNQVALVNWSFTNDEVSKAFDETVVAQTLTAKAQAELDAAVVQRARDLYLVQTQRLVAQGQLEAMNDLGITSEQGKIDYLRIQTAGKILDKGGTVVLGDSDVSMTIPAQSMATPIPTTGK